MPVETCRIYYCSVKRRAGAPFYQRASPLLWGRMALMLSRLSHWIRAPLCSSGASPGQPYQRRAPRPPCASSGVCWIPVAVAGAQCTSGVRPS